MQGGKKNITEGYKGWILKKDIKDDYQRKT
jgi:hypothetical protein